MLSIHLHFGENCSIIGDLTGCPNLCVLLAYSIKLFMYSIKLKRRRFELCFTSDMAELILLMLYTQLAISSRVHLAVVVRCTSLYMGSIKILIKNAKEHSSGHQIISRHALDMV